MDLAWLEATAQHSTSLTGCLLRITLGFVMEIEVRVRVLISVVSRCDN
jgi:hypothetical protein